MHKGYLTVIWSNDGGGGNGSGGFSFYNVEDPRSPVVTFTTLDNPEYSSTSSSNYAGNIREAHGYSFFGDYVCLPTNTRNQGGANTGIQIWDWSRMDAPANPIKVSSLDLPGLTGGDYSPTPWWVFWQGGRFVYVAGTSGGLYIVDASDPAAPILANRGPGQPNPIPTSQLGNFRLNTVFAIGNLLVCSASDANGLATYDISDPLTPVLLDKVTPGSGLYSIMVNGNKILGAHDPARIWDITNPASITLLGSGPNIADKGGYGTFQDGHFHFGSSSAYIKLDIRSLPFTATATNAPAGFVNADWDFATVLGNLVFQGNDHSGSALVVHQTQPDTQGPLVNMVIPHDKAENQALTTRIGLTFTDKIDARTVNLDTCIVRPVGGAALAGRFSYQTGIVNFWPDEPLQPNTTYQVIVPAGGVCDLVNNPSPTTFTSHFSTVVIPDLPLSCAASSAPPAHPGDLVKFSAEASGPGNMQYSWNFGDGTPSTPFSDNNSAQHSFTNPGHYSVSVIVTNGTTQASAAFVQTIYRPLTPSQPTASRTIHFDSQSNLVWCVNSDAGTVTAIDSLNFTKVFERPVGRNPRTLAQAPDGTVWVVSQGDATISVLSRDTGLPVQVPIELPHGSLPYGIAFSPDGAAGYVTLQGTGRLVRLDPTNRTITGDIDICPTPRGIAITGDAQRILVTRFISPDSHGEVVEVRADTFEVARVIGLAPDLGPDEEDSGRGLPNYLSSITISPDGLRAWVPSKKDNLERGLYRDGQPLTFESTVRTILSQIDLTTGTEVLESRLDLNDRDMAFAACFSPLGNYVFVTVQGANSVDVFDAYTGDRVTALEPTGLAPQGLVFDGDGQRLFVQNFMSRDIRVYDTTGIITSTNNLAEVLATVSTVGNETLSPQVLLGKQIFYNAADRRMNLDSYISCASCHLDGGHDGRVWDFTDRGEGLRNTPSLMGRHGTGHGRVHWTSNFDEIQDFEHDIRGPFGGNGFMADETFNSGNRNQPLGGAKGGFSAELDALAAYVSSLSEVNASPHRNPDGSLTEDGALGKQIFATLNCSSCHTGNQFTDSSTNLLLDVGTIQESSGKRLGQPLSGIDTPTLKGIWETAPYLHNGSAAELIDVFANPESYHGTLTAGTSEGEMQQLVAYLLQIDEAEIVNTPPVVALAAPLDGAAFLLPANVVLTAEVESKSEVRILEFFSNGVLLGSVTSPPFSLIWSNPPPGNHQISARATDDLGDFSWSTAKLIQVNEINSFVARINFQTADAPIPESYVPDSGNVFSEKPSGLSFGWDIANYETRYRTNPSRPSSDLRHATLNHLQKPSSPNAFWEIELPNGTYDLTAASGDADASDGYFHVLAEGVTLIMGSPSSTNRWITGSNTVEVNDGRLTLSNGPLAVNNKICYVDITAVQSEPSNILPTIAISSPSENDTFVAPASLIIIAGTNDSDGMVQRVDFYSGTTWLGATVSEPHRFIWDNVPPGEHSIRAYATDNSGGAANSLAVNITIELPQASPLALSVPKMNSGRKELSFATDFGRRYVVEYSATLHVGDWHELEVVIGDGNLKTVFDSSTVLARFYRLRAD